MLFSFYILILFSVLYYLFSHVILSILSCMYSSIIAKKFWKVLQVVCGLLCVLQFLVVYYTFNAH